MSTFLTKQEQNVAAKYLQFCESFGVEPMKNYEELIAKDARQVTPELHTDASNREEVIAIYKHRCKDFGSPVFEYLERKSVGEIWDYILRDTETVINNEFNSEFAKINDIILRKKIKVAIQMLYDESVYVKKEQTTALFACENNNDEIQEEYEKLGGKEKLLALSETSSYSCEEEEEEVNDDEEDF